MQIKETMRCFGIKESKGTFEGKEFSSTTFHLEATLAENSAGRSLGIVTRPFKFGDATEFDKWSKIPDRAFPIHVEVVFTVNAGADNGAVLNRWISSQRKQFSQKQRQMPKYLIQSVERGAFLVPDQNNEPRWERNLKKCVSGVLTDLDNVRGKRMNCPAHIVVIT